MMSTMKEMNKQTRMQVELFSCFHTAFEENFFRDKRFFQPRHPPGTGADGGNAAWTAKETIALVEVWAADDVQHSLKTCVHNSHIFVEIAEKMASMGYLRTAEQCHSRIKRLKKTYRRCCNTRRYVE